MADFEKHRELWNEVLYGSPKESVTAASKLNDLGEMSEKTLQIFILATGIAVNEKPKSKGRRKRR